MKILIVGSNKSMAIERHYVRYLKGLGAEVYQFAAPDIAYDFFASSLFNKILFRSGLYRKYSSINKALLKMADEIQPDIIWVFKGMEIFPATLKLLHNRFKLVNYNPDHPFIISSKGSGNQNVTQSLRLYDVHFCYSTDLANLITENFGIRTAILPFGFELTAEEFEATKDYPEILSACFIGNPDADRRKAIHSIGHEGLPVAVFGHGWDQEEFRKYPGVSIHDAVYGKDFWIKLRQYRVQINVFRKHNVGSHNMRTYEIPAVGGIQLSPYSDEQAIAFDEQQEIFFYRDTDEMIRQIRLLLTLSPGDANAIRDKARNKSVTNDYSYRHRAETVYQVLQTLID
jgi:spore maturation protein CgeB